MTPYPHLLAPLHIAGQCLPNRMVMGAMHTRLDTLDHPQERLAAFYARRAQGGIGLILTGGCSPTPEGVMEPGSMSLYGAHQLREHEPVTGAVHWMGGRIVLQLLHAGRYAKVPDCVAPSAIKARINSYTPRALTTTQVHQLIEQYAHSAVLAERAGYDGIEVMGSEGYLINTFTSALTNQRTDEFGGDLDQRLRFALDIIRAIKARIRSKTLLIYRISAIDLMPAGMSAEETAYFAQQIEKAGAHIINTGIGWHESAIPTIAASVPRAAWIDAIRRVKQAVNIPVMASNRINTPELAEQLLASGAADLVSMARPLLADPDFAQKTRQNRAEDITPCIACNQACLDHIFSHKTATCLVNPWAGREYDLQSIHYPATRPKKVAIVGAGAAGMACAITAAERGHSVTLFEEHTDTGGQLNLASKIPGKSEFNTLLGYFRTQLKARGVNVVLGTRVSAQWLSEQSFDDIVLATGVKPRQPDIPGIDHPCVVPYDQVLAGLHPAGHTVAILGAGGIGFDVAEFLTGNPTESTDIAAFQKAWGISNHTQAPGGLMDTHPSVQTTEDTPPQPDRRNVYLLQRTPGTPGKSLGKSTGWILKTRLRHAQVNMLSGVHYLHISDAGLHYSQEGVTHVLKADTIITCTGQHSNNALLEPLKAAGYIPHVIGGAKKAAELDAMRAIEEGMQCALLL